MVAPTDEIASHTPIHTRAIKLSRPSNFTARVPHRALIRWTLALTATDATDKRGRQRCLPRCARTPAHLAKPRPPHATPGRAVGQLLRLDDEPRAHP
eukprot:9294643-Alexandrium_andersonii.AAC.1